MKARFGSNFSFSYSFVLQTSILVLHGFSHKASGNELLGQFDIINIPPMPKVTMVVMWC